MRVRRSSTAVPGGGVSVSLLAIVVLALASGVADAADESGTAEVADVVEVAEVVDEADESADDAADDTDEEAVEDIVDAEVPVPPQLQPLVEQPVVEEAAVAEADPAHEEAASSPTPEAAEPGQWVPPLPSAKEFDWMQVRSGEWLKGEFQTLRDYRVAFDSDEFDEIDLEWKKVVSFYLPRPHSFRVQGRVIFGTAELRGDVLRIRTGDQVLEFKRSELESVAQGSGSELDWWSGKLGAGMTFRRGNTRQTEIEGTGELRRETAITRFVTSYRGAYANVNRKRTVNNHRVTSAFDVFLTRRLFWKIPFVDYYSDEFQRIDARVTPGSALGYEFVRTEWVDLEMSLGGAYQFTHFERSVEENRTRHDFAVVYTASLDTELPGGTDFDNSYRLQLVATDYGSTSHHAESLLSLDIWGPLDLDVTFVWDRIQDPAEDDDGKQAKRDDFRLLVGFGLDF